jgi:hypothetical protein
MSIHHELHRARRMRERSLTSLFLFAILVCVAVAGLTLAVLFLPNPSLLFASGSASDPATGIRAIELRGARFALPERFVTRIDHSLLRDIERADLTLPWPNSAGAVPPAQPSARDLDHLVMLTLEPAADRKTHEELLEPIYRVYFANRDAPRAGVQVHSFALGSPYADSELIADYGTPPTVIRCDLKPSVLGPVLCDRVLRFGGHVVGRVRFTRANARDARAIEAAVRARAVP